LVIGVITLTIGSAFYLLTKEGTLTFHSSPIVENLEDMGEIVGLRIQIGDVIELESDADVGVFKKVRGAWIVKGDALLSTSLKEAKFDVNEAAKIITVQLREPRVLSPRVDHEKTRQYDFTSGFMVEEDVKSRFHQEAMKNAQRTIETAAGAEDYKQMAKGNIENILKTIVATASPEWKIEFKWLGNAPQ
jgi:hypothetical protein